MDPLRPLRQRLFASRTFSLIDTKIYKELSLGTKESAYIRLQTLLLKYSATPAPI